MGLLNFFRRKTNERAVNVWERRSNRGSSSTVGRTPVAEDARALETVMQPDGVKAQVAEFPGLLSAPDCARVVVRALSGLLMDRHNECHGHFQCVLSPGSTMIVTASSNASSPEAGGYAEAYLSLARVKQTAETGNALLEFSGDSPIRKLVIQPTKDAYAWVVRNGEVVRAVAGDHSSGMIDSKRFAVRVVHESPSWARQSPPTYWEDSLVFDEMREPRLFLYRDLVGWLIRVVDTASEEGAVLLRDVALVPIVDNPRHLGLDQENAHTDFSQSTGNRQLVRITQSYVEEYGNPFAW